MYHCLFSTPFLFHSIRSLCSFFSLIFLLYLSTDEPSTGVDPVSRRFMWDFIAASMANRAVILTTHSMEECEALCARIGILVQGQLQCIGSAQRLKHRYGRGLQLDVAVAADAEDTRDVQAFVERTFIGAQLIEAYNNRLKYRVPIGGATAANGTAANASAALGASSNAVSALRLADMFEAIEIHKAALRITDYSIGQATLEQIFIRFVRSSGSGGTGEEDTVLRAQAGEEEEDENEAAHSLASASSRRLLTAAAAASPSTTGIGSLNRA
jgi:energy-coupling factor transporter ATP-binding protein EcfA2